MDQSPEKYTGRNSCTMASEIFDGEKQQARSCDLGTDNDFSSDDTVHDPTFVIENINESTFVNEENDSFIDDVRISSPNLRELPSNYCSESSATQTPSTVKTRKRRLQKQTWKQNVRKRLRQSGKEYTNSKGNIISGRSVGPSCKPTCFYQCYKNINNNERSLIHQQFWKLSDEEKNCFYNEFVKKRDCKIRRADKNLLSENRNKCSFDYYFKCAGRIFQICKQFFLNTLDISERRIYYYFNNNTSNETGIKLPSKKQHCGRKSTSEGQIKEIKDHINSFPTIESHYCRPETERKYLESHLSISKIFSLYKEKVSNPVSDTVFRNVFNHSFNLGFNIPKKDQCDKCALFKINPNDTNKSDYELHLEHKRFMKAEKNFDKNNLDSAKAVICFDLQNVLPLPKGYASSFYYKRKLTTFNLTATLILPNSKNVIYCGLWNEALMGRSGNDMASVLIKIIKRILNDNPLITEIVLWSDSCVPQNRNQIMATGLLQLLHDNKNLTNITQKFSEPGHSLVQEVDCIHSVLEKYLRNVEIPSPLSLIRLLKNMQYENVNLKIIQMKSLDFKLFSRKASELCFKQVPFTKVKIIKYEQNNLSNVSYKVHARDASFNIVSINKNYKNRFSKRIESVFSQTLTNASVKPICKEKLKDIKDMLSFLPNQDKQFFKSLLNI